MIIERLHELGITELKNVTKLNELKGDYINLECKLPNGEVAKILDDNKLYMGCQVEIADTDKCYGIAADEKQIAVYRYGCNGADAELVAWVAL
jgi:hypothetical protein